MEYDEKQEAEFSRRSSNKPTPVLIVRETKVFTSGLAFGVVARELMLNFAFGEYDPAVSDEWWVTAIIAALVAFFGAIPYYLTRRILRKEGLFADFAYPFISGTFLGISTLTIAFSYLDLVFAFPLLLLFSVLFSTANSFKVVPRLMAYAVLALSITVALALMSSMDPYKKNYTIECVRFVYWKNFYPAIRRKPLYPDLQSLSRPKLQLWLHGITDLQTDPWGNPFHYEVIDDMSLQHPHRGKFKLDYAFWSTGPDGKDDGEEKVDDIDITNAKIFGNRD